MPLVVIECHLIQKASDSPLHHGLNVNLDVPTPLHTSSNVSPELFVLNQVAEIQVEKVIRRLPSNKAPGMDKISSRILRDSLNNYPHCE